MGVRIESDDESVSGPVGGSPVGPVGPAGGSRQHRQQAAGSSRQVAVETCVHMFVSGD